MVDYSCLNAYFSQFMLDEFIAKEGENVHKVGRTLSLTWWLREESPATSSTRSPPPLTAGGPDGQRHQSCSRAPPLLRHLGCQPKLKWAGITGFDRGLGQLSRPMQTIWPGCCSRLQGHERCGFRPDRTHYCSSFLIFEIINSFNIPKICSNFKNTWKIE
jgi:hypothetical protein